ncbi:MAG: class I SAM-dependent methyltransferase [Cyclobacteriaceae bacterium]|nr:class I SAM-dependent methyltransferase [Cyclobacteriaceae bacterium]
MALEDQESAYNRKYLAGYMESWPVWKKTRVRNLIKELGIGTMGTALDFGCGKGEFTSVLRDQLLGWTIAGTDVSTEAIKMASFNGGNGHFFPLTEESLVGKSYDFIFSHHVLEHVEDLKYSVRQLSSICNLGGVMLHILPSGDTGCIENLICQWRNDGFDQNRGNRMFFEHPSHERRLTSLELIQEFRSFNMHVQRQYFSNIFFGSLEWITASNLKLILILTSIKGLRKKKYIYPLIFLRIIFVFIYTLRVPVIKLRYYYNRFRKRLRNKVIFFLCLIAYPFSFIVDQTVKLLMKLEFLFFKQKSGSEMYLIFKKI